MVTGSKLSVEIMEYKYACAALLAMTAWCTCYGHSLPAEGNNVDPLHASLDTLFDTKHPFSNDVNPDVTFSNQPTPLVDNLKTFDNVNLLDNSPMTENSNASSSNQSSIDNATIDTSQVDTPSIQSSTNPPSIQSSANKTDDVPQTASDSTSTSHLETVSMTTTTQITTPRVTTDAATTAATLATTKKPENCMLPRKDEFRSCFYALEDSAMQYIPTRNLSGFLDDICDPLRSKPIIECIKRNFQECPDFLDRPEVTSLQFGPYHIKDIHYFSSVDQMCTCSSGLVCTQELLKVKRLVGLTTYNVTNPWLKTPNFKTICSNNTSRYIGCVRQNLRQCQSPLTLRYGDDFTNDDAEDLKLMYDFTQEHCDTVNQDDFLDKYRCLEELTYSRNFRVCVRRAEALANSEKTCRLRECVKTYMDGVCDKSIIDLYIDAVNIYRHDTVRLLNAPCASAAEIGVSIVTVAIAICLVFFL